MMGHTLAIRFEIHEGDVTNQFLWPLAQTALTEVVDARFEQGRWTVSGQVGDVPLAGQAESRVGAILEYLRARLGVPDEAHSKGE